MFLYFVDENIKLKRIFHTMSSSESEDENLRKFAEAVDVTVFSDNLYNKAVAVKEEPKVQLKSQRVLDETENIFQSEINVSSTMQQFIGNKLSKIIDSKIEFVQMNGKSLKAEDDEEVDNLRLFSDTKETVKYIDGPDFVENRKKVAIKRRKVDKNVEPTEDEKIQRAAIDETGIKDEIKAWTKKPKRQPFEYKNVKGTAYLREPTNEFTKARNKNGWGESKIKTAKFHNPPLSEVIKR